MLLTRGRRAAAAEGSLTAPFTTVRTRYLSPRSTDLFIANMVA